MRITSVGYSGQPTKNIPKNMVNGTGEMAQWLEPAAEGALDSVSSTVSKYIALINVWFFNDWDLVQLQSVSTFKVVTL